MATNPNGFYLTLHSSIGSRFGDYIFRLPTPLVLNDNKWSVRLQSMSFPSDFVNSSDCYIEITKVDEEPLFLKMAALNMSKRTDLRDLIAPQLSAAVVATYFNLPKSPIKFTMSGKDSTVGFGVEADDVPGQAYSVRFSRSLAAKVGINEISSPRLAPFEYNNSHTPYINRSCEYVFVSTNIVEPQPILDVRTSDILDIFPCKTNVAYFPPIQGQPATRFVDIGNPLLQTHTSDKYVQTKAGSYTEIRITIRHENNSLITWMYDPNVVICLHFKPFSFFD